MRAIIAGLALVWTLLLGAIAVQLYQVNQSLAWISAPIRGLAEIGRQAKAPEKTETREERIERKAREQRESVDEAVEIFKRSMELDARDTAATARPSR